MLILRSICAVQQKANMLQLGLHHYYTTIDILWALPINLFFSSLARRTASANPMPEEQPVISTAFWFMALSLMRRWDKRTRSKWRLRRTGKKIKRQNEKELERWAKTPANPQHQDSAEWPTCHYSLDMWWTIRNITTAEMQGLSTNVV